MKSITLELLREGGDHKVLSKGDRYLLACGDRPVELVEMTLDHVEFLDLLHDLRYQSDEEKRDAALTGLTGHISAFLDRAGLPPDDNIQIDLVMSAAELAALPFELAAANGQPRFTTETPRVVLTRRVRKTFHDRSAAWPARPHVLFIVASPDGAGEAVPFRAHQAALHQALEPWVEPLQIDGYDEVIQDTASVLTVVKNASTATIRQACETAARPVPGRPARPFTHVHVLAHGCEVGDRPYRKYFGLALHRDDGDGIDRVDATRLIEALEPTLTHCTTLTLAACDGGNQSNTILSDRSIAHQLHARLPVVIASQLPLTFDGSTLLVDRFLNAVLHGADVRDAVHDTRVALYRNRAHTKHDWASMVAYVELPRDYADHLLRVRLETQLAALRTAQYWADQVIEKDITRPEVYTDLARRVEQRIATLASFLREAVPADVRDENLGLLGSAEKRLAELHFLRLALDRDRAESWAAKMNDALTRARQWYDEGYTANVAAHWLGIQALSLEAAQTGRIANPGRWYAVREAARSKPKHGEHKLWSAGSLTELYLLAPCAGLDRQPERARLALDELRDRAANHADDRFVLESTRRQLGRYVGWWTAEHGFFPDGPDLVNDAKELLARLE